MARTIDSETAYQFLTDQLVKETGAFSRGVNKGLNIARSAMRNPDAMPTITLPNEWVSVEERLPEVGQEVLVYWRNTSQKAEHFELTHYEGDHWFLLDNTGRPWIVVVAWMPLPAPPDRRPPEGETDE